MKCKRSSGGHQIRKRKNRLSQSACFRSIQWALVKGRRVRTCSSLRALMKWAVTQLAVQKATIVRTRLNQCSFNRARRKSAVSLKLSQNRLMMLLKKCVLSPRKKKTFHRQLLPKNSLIKKTLTRKRISKAN